MDFTLATVAYADIFDYPLTREELKEWMIFGAYAPKQRKKYYFLPGRDNLVRIREERHTWQPEKWEIAGRAASILSRIPTVQLVGATGGLAMNNARREDDIDLFCIVADGTIWITRILSVLYLWRLRRKRNDTRVANKICLNMFMTETNVALPENERDLFSAHEVLQMKPLWQRGRVYEKFLTNNEWARVFLPNAQRQKVKSEAKSNVFLFRLFEPLAKIIQLWYMAGHRTHEVITDTTLRFHPKDARAWVKRKLRARLAKLDIPLDKIFYAS